MTEASRTQRCLRNQAGLPASRVACGDTIFGALQAELQAITHILITIRSLLPVHILGAWIVPKPNATLRSVNARKPPLTLIALRNHLGKDLAFAQELGILHHLAQFRSLLSIDFHITDVDAHRDRAHFCGHPKMTS